MPRGRQTKLTPERSQKILQAIEAGNYIEIAAPYGGIGVATFYTWMDRGRTDAEAGRKTIYRDFMEAVEIARAQAEARNVALIQRAAQDPARWQAAAWWLERRDPQRWGRRVNQIELTGKDGGPVEVSVDDARQSVVDFLDTLAE